MKKKALLTGVALLLFAGILNAHTLFIKLDTYFLKPHSTATIALVNGTFDKSENAIARRRMTDVSVVGPGDEVMHPDTSRWREQGTLTLLDLETGEPGTYVVGVSTAPSMIALAAEDFNEYLEHDGVLDVLAARKRDGELGLDARERYSKHVKALVQVGDRRTGAFGHRLGYPAEIVPVNNPYALGVGDTFEVLVLVDGKPVANQYVEASHEGYHGHDAEGGHRIAVQTRTDETGVARIPLEAAGRWYVKLIHMARVDDGEADYESKWATLTFEVR
ncbi:DUF4198 domain-containing protein [Rhodocaloribacter sp.]